LPAGQTFVTNRVGDPAAAERDLGFRWAVDLREGMGRLVEWRRTHKEDVARRRRAAGL
jgi:UDP-glucose 4-epimerase